MVKKIETAITSHSLIRIRMNNTPEGSWITVEPYLVVNNVLYNETRLLMFVLSHWTGGALGWKHIPLTSIIDVEILGEKFQQRTIEVMVDWQIFDQVFPA